MGWRKVTPSSPSSPLRRQCGRVGRAPDLKCGGPGVKSRSDRWLELFHGRPEFNSSATLVNSQLACLLSVGIFNPVMFNLKYLSLIFECSAPLAPCYNHLPRVNKGYLHLLLAGFAGSQIAAPHGTPNKRACSQGSG